MATNGFANGDLSSDEEIDLRDLTSSNQDALMSNKNLNDASNRAKRNCHSDDKDSLEEEEDEEEVEEGSDGGACSDDEEDSKRMTAEYHRKQEREGEDEEDMDVDYEEEEENVETRPPPAVADPNSDSDKDIGDEKGESSGRGDVHGGEGTAAGTGQQESTNAVGGGGGGGGGGGSGGSSGSIDSATLAPQQPPQQQQQCASSLQAGLTADNQYTGAINRAPRTQGRREGRTTSCSSRSRSSSSSSSSSSSIGEEDPERQSGAHTVKENQTKTSAPVGEQLRHNNSPVDDRAADTGSPPPTPPTNPPASPTTTTASTTTSTLLPKDWEEEALLRSSGESCPAGDYYLGSTQQQQDDDDELTGVFVNYLAVKMERNESHEEEKHDAEKAEDNRTEQQQQQEEEVNGGGYGDGAGAGAPPAVICVTKPSADDDEKEAAAEARDSDDERDIDTAATTDEAPALQQHTTTESLEHDTAESVDAADKDTTDEKESVLVSVSGEEAAAEAATATVECTDAASDADDAAAVGAATPKDPTEEEEEGGFGDSGTDEVLLHITPAPVEQSTLSDGEDAAGAAPGQMVAEEELQEEEEQEEEGEGHQQEHEPTAEEEEEVSSADGASISPVHHPAPVDEAAKSAQEPEGVDDALITTLESPVEMPEDSYHALCEDIQEEDEEQEEEEQKEETVVTSEPAQEESQENTQENASDEEQPTFIEHPSPTLEEEQQEQEQPQDEQSNLRSSAGDDTKVVPSDVIRGDDKVDDGIDSGQSISSIKSRFSARDEKPPMPSEAMSRSSRSSTTPSNGHVNGDRSPPEVVNRSESTEEILERELPPVNMARSLASKFRELESSETAVHDRKPVRKITPPREDLERDVARYTASSPERDENIVRADVSAEKGDELPPPSFTKNMLARFKEMEDTTQPPPSPGRAATSPTKRTPRSNVAASSTAYIRSSPDEGIADTEPSLNGHHGSAQSPAAEVVRETDKAEAEELPERGFTKSLLAQWRQIEQTDTSKSPSAPRRSTPVSSGYRGAAIHEADGDVGPREVVREGDSNEEEFLPPPSYTKNMLAKFQSLQQEAQKDPATTPTKKQFKWTVKETKPLWTGASREEFDDEAVNGYPNNDEEEVLYSSEDEEEILEEEEAFGEFSIECDEHGNPLYPINHPRHPENVRRRQMERRKLRLATSGRREVVRSSRTADPEEDLPPPETTKKLLSQFKSLEDVSVPPPTPERSAKLQRVSRSSIGAQPLRQTSSSSAEHTSYDDDVAAAAMNDTNEYSELLVESGEYENTPQSGAAGVVREADTNIEAEFPERGLTRNLLAKFQSLE